MPYRLRSGPRPHSRSRAAASTTFSASLEPKPARPKRTRPSATLSPSPRVLNLAFGSHPFPSCSFEIHPQHRFDFVPRGTKIPADAACVQRDTLGSVLDGAIGSYFGGDRRCRRRIVSPATLPRQPKSFDVSHVIPW